MKNSEDILGELDGLSSLGPLSDSRSNSPEDISSSFPLPEFGSVQTPEFFNQNGNALDSPVDSGHRRLCVSVHEPIRKRRKSHGDRKRRRRPTSHNTALGPQITRKVVKKSELTRWQAERIQKDAELTKYIHIDSSERSEEEEAKFFKERHRSANICAHPKTFDSKGRRMSKQVSGSSLNAESLKLSSAIKSTDLNYQSTERPYIEPKSIFVELEELHEDDKTKKMEWVETARWLKYEEDVEKSERWGKPHVSSLSFHSLLDLRRGFSKGIAVIDSKEVTLQGVAHEALNKFVRLGILKREHKEVVLQALLLKHKHQHQSKKKRRKSVDFLAGKKNKRAFSLAPQSLSDSNEGSPKEKKRLSCPDEELGTLQRIQRRISSLDLTFGTRSNRPSVSRETSEPGPDRRQSLFERLQLKIGGFRGRTDNSDLEACILTNQSSEAPSLPSVAEETDKEAKPADDVTKQETGEDAEERKISEISDKLVWDVLQKVKTDLEKEGGQGSKRKLTRNRTNRKTVSFMEPRKSTVGLSSRNEDTPTLSPSAHFVINNPVAEEEEEEEEGVKVLDAITKRIDTTSESEEMDGCQLESNVVGVEARGSNASRRVSTAQFIKRKLSKFPLVRAALKVEKYIFPGDQEKANKRFLRSGSLPPDCEAAPVLVAKLDFLTSPLVAFIRLADAQYFDDITEYYIPVRFLFLVIGPPTESVDYHEVGRSIATIMSNQDFQQKMYSARDKEEVLEELNTFLNDSIVLPPGEYGADHILPKSLQNAIRKRKKKAEEIDEDKRVRYPAIGHLNELKQKDSYDPLSRTGRFFGGLIRDVKALRKRYLSDIRDGVNLVTLESVLLMFGLMLAPAITFGGLAGKHTYGDYGVIEMLISCCFGGLVFSLLTGQPLTVFGCTGPIYVFEVHLSHFAHLSYIHFDFLQWRAWIGCWIFLFFTSFSFLELGFLIHYFTRFTEEIVTVMVSLIFLYEAGYDMIQVFKENPITSEVHNNETEYCKISRTPLGKKNPGCPNTALFSLILMLGTFIVAYCLKKLRKSPYLRQRLRSVMSGFGITLAMILMIIIANLTQSVYTEPLDMPDTFRHTNVKRKSWLIDMFDTKVFNKYGVPIWVLAVSSVIPAFLVSVLIIMESHLTGVLVNNPSHRLVKGCTPNWDTFLMGVILLVCSLLGLPWLCADSVRTMTHIKTLTVYSKYSAPGEKPRVLYIHEQRVTIVLVHILVGLFLLFPDLIQSIPVAVLLGVFLFLGFISLSGLQFVKRFEMLFMSSKYFPDYSFTRKVRTSKIHLFTIVQFILAGIMFGIKLSPVSPLFPICVIGLALMRRYAMSRIWTEEEINELDPEESGSEDDSDRE